MAAGAFVVAPVVAFVGAFCASANPDKDTDASSTAAALASDSEHAGTTLMFVIVLLPVLNLYSVRGQILSDKYGTATDRKIEMIMTIHRELTQQLM